jgi:hypothetical protein
VKRLALALAAFLAGCEARLIPPTPPILSGASAGGGWSLAGCPPANNTERSLMRGGPEALSPQLDERLNARFPAGASGAGLESFLRSQGFVTLGFCANDSSIERMQFRQTGGGFYGPYPAFALVAWKVDDRGRVTWIKGYVAYTGP